MHLSSKRMVIFAAFSLVLVGAGVYGLGTEIPTEAVGTLEESPEIPRYAVTEKTLETSERKREQQPCLTPVISVYPRINTPSVGDNFTISVIISNVTDLQGYEFKLGYDTSILTATEIAQGDFFSDFWLLKKEIDQTKKRMWLAVHLPLGSQYGVSGSGTLATINFKAKSTGSCTLNFSDTKLVSFGEAIRHEVEDGYFEFKIRQHDLTVFTDTPNHLEPGDSSLLNATIVNKGLCNETNIQLQLLINDTVVDSVIIPWLQVGTSHTLNYLWTPTVATTYNVTAYVTPVSGENHKSNNVISARVVVRPPIKVPGDYLTIRKAVDSAVSGEVILVASGTYYEQSLTIDKSLALIGEESSTTIIDGKGTKEMTIYIVADHVTISGFTIRNSFGGVLLDHSNGHNFIGNTITNTHDSLNLLFSCGCTIIANTIENNDHGITLGYSSHNTIHHNNFINNTAESWCLDSNNTWNDSKGEGNYWSNYNGTDLDGDDVGDEYLPWEFVDYHPLTSQVTTADMWKDKAIN